MNCPINKWKPRLIVSLFACFGVVISTVAQVDGVAGRDNGFDNAQRAGDVIEFLDPDTGVPTDLIILDELCAGETVDFCFEVQSSSFDHNITGFSGNIGEVILTPFTAPFDTCYSYTAPFGYVGNDTILFEVTNFIGTVGEVEVVYTITDPSTPIDAGPTQQLCSETTGILSAINPDTLAAGNWILFSGGGTITDPTNPTTTVTDLPPGTSTFLWSQNYPCGQANFDVTQIQVFLGDPPVSNAGDDVELCSGTSYPMDAIDPGNSASGTWEVLQGQAFISDINDPTTVVTNLAVGVNVFQWNISNGSCPGGESSDQMIIYVFDSGHPPANAGLDQFFCSDDFVEVEMNAQEPVIPATGEWESVSGLGTIEDLDDVNTLITDLPPGIHEFAWHINNGPCGILSDTVQVFIYDDNLNPAFAGPDAEYCLPSSAHNMSANAVALPAVGTWTLVSGQGAIADPNDPNTVVSNLGVGENIFAWTLDNGVCTNDGSSDTVSITIFDSAVNSAYAGEDAIFCDTEFSEYTLEADPVPSPAYGEWSVSSGSGSFADINDPNTVVSGLSPGENELVWTVYNGACGHYTDEVVLTLFTASQNPVDAGDDAEYCTPESTHIMNATPPTLPAGGEWTLISGTGTISDINDPNATITGLGVGLNVYRWTLTNGPCGSSGNFDEVTIYIFDENQILSDAGDDQEVCLNPALPLTVQLEANIPIAPAIGSWTLLTGVGTISDENDPMATVTDLGVGQLLLTWTIDNGACTPPFSVDDVVITVFDAFEAGAIAGPDQDLCFDDPSTTLAASLPTFPATGLWTVLSGSADFADDSSPTTGVTGLSVGVNELAWTVDNGACGAPTTDTMIITVFDDSVPPVNAGEDISICSTTTSVVLDGSVVIPPANGIWTVASGTAAFDDDTQFNTSVTGLSLGENELIWTVDNGPCGVTNSDTVSVFVSNVNAPLADAGEDQNLCSISPTTFMTANAAEFPAIGTWTLFSGTGNITDPNDPLTEITGLAVGENVFQWTIDNGPCVPATSIDFVSLFVFDDTAPEANAGPDQSFCSQVTTVTLTGNEPVSPAFGFWTLVGGSATIASPDNGTTNVTDLAIGENIFQWTINSGACPDAVSTDLVSVFIYDENQEVANAGDDQSFCSTTTSTTLDGNAVTFPAVGIWSLISGTGGLTDANDPNTEVTGLGIGENIFEWTIDNGPCGAPTSDLMSIFISDDNAADATAGPDQSICNTTPSVTMAANAAVFPGTATWTLVSGAGIISDPSDPNTDITSLAVGENVFSWTIDNNGCSGGLTSDEVSIFVYFEDATVANAGPDQNLCTPASSTFLGGNAPVFPATGSWSLVSGNGVVTTPNDPTSEVTGLAIGENIFEWSINNGPCTNGTTTDQVSIFVFNSGFDAPFAGDDQELCTPTSTTFMTADAAVDPGIGTWTLFSGSGSVTSPNDPLSEVTGLTLGVNTFVWEVNYATCGNPTDTVNIVVFDSNLADADAGMDQAFCAPTSTTNLAAIPVIGPAFGTWSLLSGNGIIVDPLDPTTEVQSLTVGENVFVWEVYNGGCNSAETLTDTMSVFIFDVEQLDADAGPDQDFCTPVSDATLAANAVTFPAAGTWTLFSGSGTITSPNDPNSTVTGLLVGENIFHWTIDNGPCGAPTTDEVIINIFDENQAPANAGDNQSICTPDDTVTLGGNALTSPATGLWTLVSGTGVFDDPTDPATEVSGLTIGENIFEWTVDNGPCNEPTTDAVSVFVFDENQQDAFAGFDGEFCTPLTSIFLSANTAVFPAAGQWSLAQGSANILNPNSSFTQVIEIGLGENLFVWTIDNGPCPNGITTDTLQVIVYDELADLADAGNDIELCSPDFDTTLTANVSVYPAIGSWSLIQGSGDLADPLDPFTSVDNLAIGENIFQWEVYNGPCTLSGSTDQVSVFVYDETQEDADAGPDQELCTPFITTTMAGNTPLDPAVGTWTQIEGTSDIIDPNDPTTTVTDLSIGNNVFVWTIYNGPCEGMIRSDTVLIAMFDGNLQEAYAGEDHSFCLPDNFATLTATPLTEPATGEWTLLSGTGNILDPTSDITNVTNIEVGVSTFIWTVDNGECGMDSDTVLVSIFDPDAPGAIAGPDQFLCTPQTSTAMSGNTPAIPGFGQWDLIGGTATINEPNHPETVVSGLTIGENILTWTIDNGPCGPPTVDTLSVFIFDENAPDAYAGEDQELCIPENNTFMTAGAPIFPATGTWTQLTGTSNISDINDAGTFVSDLSLGTNTFVWTVDNTPCAQGITSDTLEILVFTEIIQPPNAGDDQAYCTPVSSTFMTADTPDDPNTGTWEVLAGNGSFADVNDPETEVTGLTVGINEFIWNVYNGPCLDSLFTDTMQVLIYDGAQPSADAGADQELCLPVTTTVMAANQAIVPAVGTWELIAGSGTLSDPNDPLALVSGLQLGVNSFTWTIDNGVCPDAITVDTVSVTVFTNEAAVADAGLDLEICTPQDLVTMTALPPDAPTVGTWALISGSATISDVNDPNAEISSLIVGVHVLEWTIYNGPCIDGNSTDFITITVFDANSPLADAGLDLDFCAPVDSTQLDAADPIFPSMGIWTIESGPGDLADPADPNTWLTDMQIGTTVLTWQADNGPCNEATLDTMIVTVYDPDSPFAQVGPDQQFCSPFTGTTLTGNQPLPPSIGYWEVISGSAEISDSTLFNSGVTDVGFGNNILTWTIDNGPCASLSTDTLVISLNDLSVSQADAGPDVFDCGMISQLQMQGSATVGNTATGTWSIAGGGGMFDDITNESSLVYDIPIGVNSYVWTVDNLECGVSSDTVNVIVFNPEHPPANAGLGGEICEDEFEPFELGATPAVFPATGFWEILEGPIELSNSGDPMAEVLDLGSLPAPLATETSVITWTINNGACGVTTDTISFVLIDCLTVVVPDAFSPNNDGFGDIFDIPNLDKYPQNSIEIYNRWGSKVYEAAPYLNDWDGTSNAPLTLNGELPVSTYYYVLDLGNGDKPRTGFIYLRR